MHILIELKRNNLSDTSVNNVSFLSLSHTLIKVDINIDNQNDQRQNIYKSALPKI